MMGQSNFLDEIDCGSFFDHIDDLIDFPMDDVVDAGPGSVAASAAPHSGDFTLTGDIWPTHCDSLPAPASASDLSAELSVPYEDIVQLEWLSNFVEDSFSGGNLQGIDSEDVSVTVNNVVMRQQFQTSSPVSVLESSSSCSGEKTSPRSPDLAGSARCGRARSKRPRPATFTPRPAMQLISTSSLPSEITNSMIMTPKAESESFAESRLVIKIPKHCGVEQKKKKLKVTPPMVPSHCDLNCLSQQAVRKCMHCEITKTPQWRAGPMGPKTLCNACGVRFKSGRLFPEYRPAASPTFIPSLHSNSHKKVLEMRNKGGEKVVILGGVAVVTKSPELIPNKSSIPMGYM